MKASHTAVNVFTVMAVAAATTCWADEKEKVPPVKPPSETEMRAVITRGLGFLVKEGDEWMAIKNCNSCHHLPELLWSHRAAKERGFAVDPKKFDEWLTWALERIKEKKPQPEEAALMILAMPDRPAPDLVKRLAAEQKTDGHWEPAGQFSSMQKRGASDARFNTTRLSLIALATPQPAAPELEVGRANASRMLQKENEPTSMESLVYQTVYARRFGKQEDTDVLLQQILKQQRGDGGWSSIIGENMSDPLATGQVLYALQPSSSNQPTDAAIARAQAWLVKTQLADGSWPIDITHISKVDRSAPAKAKSFGDATGIYTYWGSSWATIGLLQGVPVKQP